MKMESDKIKKYQIKLWVIGFIAIATSVIIIYSKIRYGLLAGCALLAIAVSIFLASLLTALACPKYNGSYNFVMGTFVGLMVSLGPALILRNLRSDNLWLGVIILGWAAGGYLSIRDIVIRSDDFLDSPLAKGMSIVGVFFAFIVSLLIFSLIIPVILAIFSISIPYLYSVIISLIIANVFVVQYLSKKIYSEDLEELEYKPHVRGTFGSFLGGITSVISSLLIGYIYSYLTDISMTNLWMGAYAGLVAGVLVGFLIGYQTEKISFTSSKD